MAGVQGVCVAMPSEPVCAHVHRPRFDPFIYSFTGIDGVQGVCVAMPVYYATGSRWKGFWWAFLSGLSEPLGGLLGWLVLGGRTSDLSYGILFTVVGGMMVRRFSCSVLLVCVCACGFWHVVFLLVCMWFWHVVTDWHRLCLQGTWVLDECKQLMLCWLLFVLIFEY